MTYSNMDSDPPAGWTVYRVGQGIFAENGKVLLSGNRWYTDKPLVWTLPGGRAEDGESVSEAVVREFREETGLETEVLDLAYVAESRSSKSRRLFLVCAFTMRKEGGQLGVQRDAGVEDLRFVSPDELAEYLPSESLGEPLRYFLAHPTEQARYWFFPEYGTAD